MQQPSAPQSDTSDHSSSNEYRSATSAAAQHPEDASRATKRPRLQHGLWPEADETNRVFAAAGKVFQTTNLPTPGSSDDDQAMDLLVRLWSPASHDGDEPDIFSNQLHPSNATSPSTTSPTPDDAPGASMPPVAQPGLSAVAASIAHLPMAHAWPLPAHLQPHARPPWAPQSDYGGQSASRARDPREAARDAYLEQRYRPGAHAPAPASYYMAPRPLKLGTASLSGRPPPPPTAGGAAPIATDPSYVGIPQSLGIEVCPQDRKSHV